MNEVRVLLLEDDRSTAMVVERRLRAVEAVTCSVECVQSLAQARERLARGRFDLVIADLHLPDSPGLATIESLVRICQNPVIALTADDDPVLRERAMAGGAYDFLLKGQLDAGALERLVRLAALQANTLYSLQRFRSALDTSADMVVLFNLADGRLLDFNQSACTQLGYSREELLASGPEVARMLNPEDSGDSGDGLITEYRRRDGSAFPVESRRSVLDTPQGRVLVINSRDLTERRSAERRRAAQARYQKKISRLGQAALDHRDAGEFIQKAVQSVLEGLGGAGAVAYIERGPGEGEVILRRAAGLAEPALDAQAATLAPGEPLGYVLERSEHALLNAPWTSRAPLPFAWSAAYASAVLVPVPGGLGARGALCALSEQPGALGPEETRFLGAAASLLSAALHRFDSEARLAYLAQFDALTGLPNRALLFDRFSQMAVQARRRGTTLGVLFIDLDEFKLVNDTLGHAAGDELLREVASRLKSTVRPGDTVARISGDEFAVVLLDLSRPDDAAIVAQKILDRLAAPVMIGGQETFITASVGISTFPADGKDAEVLLGAADAAMYRAKQAGRNAFQFFTIEINQRTRARAQLGGELRRAFERREFQLAWQPKIDLASGRPRGAEALLRWGHPERGIITSGEFIPVLEETGLIVPVGEWVLRAACEDLRRWQAQGLKELHVAVNLSARQFRQQDLDVRIRDVVESAGVDPSKIELEITESQLMNDPEQAVRVLRALTGAGLRIAIDDFGTGYSSLAYLTRFPLTSLKIDKSFVADVLTDEADATIVRTIIDMAHTLGFTVIAEGVESEQQAALLRALGCEQAQGYLFARPMPADDLARFILASRTAATPRRTLRRT
jgi:diguanylate cyclase (GGDEF)-like protein/PAS domain S-box-containing protein